MTFYERLKKVRTDLGLTQPQVSEALLKKGLIVKAYTISKWENGKREPKIAELTALCELYGIKDIMLLLSGRPSLMPPMLLDGLNDKGKAHVKNYVKFLKNDPVFTDEDDFIEIRTCRLYDISVSAGTGMYLDSSDYEEITADDLIPEDTDYAVRVSGDSMEPEYHDGQILFIKEQQTLNEGEIGIFALNGEAFVKKLIKNTLVSLNPEYKPIKLGENDNIRIFGKVIGSH